MTWIKKGVKLIEESVGGGAVVQRQVNYVLAIRITLNRGEVVDLSKGGSTRVYDEHFNCGSDGFLESRMRFDRENLIGGIFYSLEGMRIGGYRKVEIAPHLAYGESGVPGLIPAHAKLTVEIKVIRELSDR